MLEFTKTIKPIRTLVRSRTSVNLSRKFTPGKDFEISHSSFGGQLVSSDTINRETPEVARSIPGTPKSFFGCPLRHGFWWVMDILNNFSCRFQKCKFYQRRTHPVDAQGLPTHPTYRLGYRLCGQSWCVEGVCLIKKSRRVLLLELKNVVGTPNVLFIYTYLYCSVLWYLFRRHIRRKT